MEPRREDSLCHYKLFKLKVAKLRVGDNLEFGDLVLCISLMLYIITRGVMKC